MYRGIKLKTDFELCPGRGELRGYTDKSRKMTGSLILPK